MPRRERREAARSITASARSYRSGFKRNKDKREDVRGGEMWQRSTYDFYNLVGEFRQAPTIQGALLSRAKLVCLEKDSRGKWKPTKNVFARAAMDMLYGGEEGQSEMLRLCGEHFTVAGKAFIVAPPAAQLTDPNAWQVVAATQALMREGTWKINGKEIESGRDVIEIWRPHLENGAKPNAPAMAALPILAILVQLMKRTAAQVDSRLTGNGIVLLPSETEFPSGPSRVTNPGEPSSYLDGVDANDPQGLADMLMDVARVAIEDPSSAEAMLPIFGMAEGDHLKDIKHLTFWSELDKAAPALREELITRLARTMDIPVEVLLGAAGSNHWNAWLSDENNVKVHAEPTLKIITSGLTTKFLRPLLEAEGLDPLKFKIWADTAEMRLRPNRSKESLELNDRMLLKDEVTLRENGFTEDDMMDEKDLKKAIMRKMVQGTSTPELVALAANYFGLELPTLVDNREPVEGRPTPTLLEHPTRDTPEQAAHLVGLTFAAEQMVDRALQRAGNRLKVKLNMKDVPASANRLYMATSALTPGSVDDLLQDAWDCVYLDDYGIPPKEFARALDAYTRSLILSQREPTRTGIRAALTLLLRRDAA